MTIEETVIDVANWLTVVSPYIIWGAAYFGFNYHYNQRNYEIENGE